MSLSAIEAAASEPLWESMSMTDITEQIEVTEHELLRVAMAKASALIARAVQLTSGEDPDLIRLRDLFLEFRSDVEVHMAKEEIIIFPVCRKMELVRDPYKYACGSIKWPVECMILDHGRSLEQIARIADLSQRCAAPSQATGLFDAMRFLLREIGEDCRKQAQVENDILFPRAMDAEQKLATYKQIEACGI